MGVAGLVETSSTGTEQYNSISREKSGSTRSGLHWEGGREGRHAQNGVCHLVGRKTKKKKCSLDLNHHSSLTGVASSPLSQKAAIKLNPQ